MPELCDFYNKRKLYYTESMKKKTTSTRTKQPVASFEPGKVSLAIASLAAITILLLAIVGVTN